MKSRIVTLFLLITFVFDCSSMENNDVCQEGHKTARNGNFEEATNFLTKCLNTNELSPKDRAEAFKSRAWAHYNLHKDSMAVQDQEAAFELVKPAKYNELVNYATYLRKVRRYKDSINTLNVVVKIDEASGHLSMMTQYNLGWSLYENGQFKDAVAAFTKGIPAQPDFTFIYWKRGLAYHALGMRVEAKSDFINYKKYLKSNNTQVPILWQFEIHDVISQYNL